jgi:hypothetical protein
MRGLRHISVLVLISFMALGLSPAAMGNCCCKSRNAMQDVASKPCCQAVKHVKSCCNVQAKSACCSAKGMTGGVAPRCKCLDQLQTAAVTGIAFENNHMRVSVFLNAISAPDLTENAGAAEHLLPVDTLKNGELILLKTCILTC